MKKYDVKQVGVVCFGAVIAAYFINLIMSFFYIDAFNIVNVILNLLAPVSLFIYAYKFAKSNQKLFFQIGTGIYILQNTIAFFYSVIANIKALVNSFSFGVLISMLIAACAAAYTVACLVFAFLISIKGARRPNTKSIMALLFIILGVLNVINAISGFSSAIAGCVNGADAGRCTINIISSLLNIVTAAAIAIGYLKFNDHIISKYLQARANAKKAAEASNKSESKPAPKKAEPAKKTEPAKKVEPAKKTEPAKKAEPVKKAESVKKAEPVKKATTTKKPANTSKSTSAKSTTTKSTTTKTAQAKTTTTKSATTKSTTTKKTSDK